MNEHLDIYNRMKSSISNILSQLGVDANDQHFQRTPDRVANAYITEIFSGYFSDEPKITTFKVDKSKDQMVTITNIQFHSMCAHHMLPFTGHAHIGYIPNELIFGVSKFARIVDWLARRLTVQEELTIDITKYLMDKLNPLGVGVQLRAAHSCMVCRGVMQNDSLMITTALRGYFLERTHVKEEWLQCIL